VTTYTLPQLPALPIPTGTAFATRQTDRQLSLYTVEDKPLNMAVKEARHSPTIRYDTIEEFNVYSKAECVQLNLAHVARRKKIYIKEETKTNKRRQYPVSSVLYRFKIREGSSCVCFSFQYPTRISTHCAANSHPSNGYRYTH